MRRLAWVSDHLCDKYHNLVSWLKYLMRLWFMSEPLSQYSRTTCESLDSNSWCCVGCSCCLSVKSTSQLFKVCILVEINLRHVGCSASQEPFLRHVRAVWPTSSNPAIHSKDAVVTMPSELLLYLNPEVAVSAGHFTEVKQKIRG